MDGNALITDVRDAVQDAVVPYLWSDDRILKYLREAEDLMCRETHVLIETDLLLSASAAVSTHVLPERVLQALACRVVGSTEPLRRLRSAVHGFHMRDTVGTPRYFSTNLGDKQVTVYPVPEVDTELEFICAIIPKSRLDFEKDSAIPERHQHALVDYAAYRCLIIPDEDGENLINSEIYKERWGVYLRDLKRDIYRYRTGDRLMIENWTGIRNG